jgi:hypothetical protein
MVEVTFDANRNFISKELANHRTTEDMRADLANSN